MPALTAAVRRQRVIETCTEEDRAMYAACWAINAASYRLHTHVQHLFAFTIRPYTAHRRTISPIPGAYCSTWCRSVIKTWLRCIVLCAITHKLGLGQ